MSTKLIQKLLQVPLPPGEKLVLVILAYYADDDGMNCFPSVSRTARESGLTRRGVQKIMHRLRIAGLLVPIGTRSSGTISYQIVTPASEHSSQGGANVVRSELGDAGGRTEFAGGANWETQRGELGSPDLVRPVIDLPVTKPLCATPSKTDVAAPRKTSAAKTPRALSPAGLRLATLLRSEILRNKPDARIDQNWERNWSSAADRMIRLDQRSEEQIAAVILWCQRDEFWLANILSMSTLRDQFDQLELKAGFKCTAAGTRPASVPARQREQFRCKVRIPLGLNRKTGEVRWNAALDQFKQRLSRNAYDTWFLPSKACGIGRGVLYVRVPNAETSSTISTQYSALLQEFLSDLRVEFRAASMEVSHA